MQTTEKISPRESSRKADPEDYDLVILAAAQGQPSLHGHLLQRENGSQSSIANTLADHAQTSHACQAKTSSTERKSRLTFGGAKNLASLTMASLLRCQASANASARW